MRLLFTLSMGIALLPALASAQPIDGLYIAGGAGGNYLQRSSGQLGGQAGRLLQQNGLSREVSFDSNLGWGGVASIGWGFGNGLRLEVEGSYRSNDSDTVTLAGYRLLRNGGSVYNYGVMANVFYDFDLSSIGIPSSAVMPYVGGGIGYVWRDHDNVRGSINVGPASGVTGGLTNGLTNQLVNQLTASLPPETPADVRAEFVQNLRNTLNNELNSVTNSTASAQIRSDDVNGSLAYQGIAGLAFPIRWVPGLAATLEYRFMATEGVKLRTTATARINNGAPTTLYSRNTEFDNYNHSIMLGVRYAFNTPRPAPAVMTDAPAPAAAPVPARTYLVFFDFDRADLTDRARQIITEAAQNANRVQTTRIEVAGHADRAGSPQYNQRLSQRRADAVAAELTRQGIQRSAITVQAFGESRPLVATADGVREPQNRRVEIVLR
ncbi:OmpA family protein [Teichococcus wenyumeiae]|nr:OmpA family protein [Pseudoroseomonas wenyumeiae]